MGFSRFRWLFIICLLVLGMSMGVVGTVVFALRQADRTAGWGDTRVTLDRAAQEVTHAFQSRRERFLLLRDALDQAPALSDAERTAFIRSAMGLTPDLLGGGLIRGRKTLQWWIPPLPAETPELARLSHDITQRLWVRIALRWPSTLMVRSSDRPWLVMVEPFRARANRSDLILAVFDPHLLAEQALQPSVPSSVPLRLVGDRRPLYRSSRWESLPMPATQPLLEHSIEQPGIRWTLQVPAEAPRLVPRVWLNALIGAIVGLAGMAMAGMVWTVERLRRLATTDELTGLYNRRYFLERWGAEHARAKRYQRPLSCLMIDVDGFKQVNDRLGHPMGDRLLRQLAQGLQGHLRQSDLLARFGGDEFIVALPETTLQQARVVREKLAEVVTLRGPWEARLPGPVRISVGASQMENDELPEQTIRRADVGLALAKHAKHQTPIVKLRHHRRVGVV